MAPAGTTIRTDIGNTSMVKPRRKLGKRAKRKPLTVVQLQRREQRVHTKAHRVLFEKLGFAHLQTDGVQINFKGRTGELDDIFISQNLVLIVEYTIGRPDSSHLAKKKILYDLILSNLEEFLGYAESVYPKLKGTLDPLYPRRVVKARILYASKQDPSAELIAACPNINFIHGATFKYFQALVGAIEKSARIEFLKFLGFQYDEVGEGAISSSRGHLAYDGFLLPDGNSSYPANYKVVSFYADPERLISRSYVLRRDGWRDESHLYQRILVPKKIKQMRRYLVDERRVFVNNIIVTLPPETQLRLSGSGKDIKDADLGKVRAVTVQIPDGFDTIGLVDGQHRVFCYHEGSDKGEEEIKILRKRQNLMVTGIVYPQDVSAVERRSFEAKLFLEINDNQTPARPALKHDIEVIIRPGSGIAIAKRVVQELGRRGPYKGMLQSSYFDPPTKIKTSSIVSYGLRPLVKLDGTDSLFTVWSHFDKAKLKDSNAPENAPLLEEYVKFCTDKINELFVEMKLAANSPTWDIEATPHSPLLSPTAINGMIVCLRKIIENGHQLSSKAHKKQLKNIPAVKFTAFKSSQWQKLGALIYEKHYA